MLKRDPDVSGNVSALQAAASNDLLQALGPGIVRFPIHRHAARPEVAIRLSEGLALSLLQCLERSRFSQITLIAAS